MRGREEIAAAARACVGARFRVHGRDPALGLDCVGVCARAFGIVAPARYALRGGSADAIGATIARAGLRRITTEAAGPGDMVLIEAGAGQWHLAVLTPAGFVHADAGLGRVVEVPGRPVALAGAWAMGEN